MIASEIKEKSKCRGNRYCFPCVSGLCPNGLDFTVDCYPELDSELMELFDELFFLRTEILKKSFLKKHLILEV